MARIQRLCSKKFSVSLLLMFTFLVFYFTPRQWEFISALVPVKMFSILNTPEKQYIETQRNQQIYVNKNIHPCITIIKGNRQTEPDGKEINSYRKVNCRGVIFPKCINNRLVGPLYIDQSHPNDATLQGELGFVNHGGWWRPSQCKESAQTAIIIPFRDRELHLKILLRQLHPILKRQHLHYRIFVIEQVDSYSFNRAKLMNVGFIISQTFFPYSCFVFHDVDLLPENDNIDYGCRSSPAHLSVGVDKFSYVLLYEGLFGGVEMFSREHFLKINGFSNSYWHWGGEDDDLYFRTKQHNLSVHRQSIYIARYSMIKHNDSVDLEKSTIEERRAFLYKTEEYAETDGLNSLQYEIVSIKEYKFYTKISVNLRKDLDDLLWYNL